MCMNSRPVKRQHFQEDPRWSTKSLLDSRPGWGRQQWIGRIHLDKDLVAGAAAISGAAIARSEISTGAIVNFMLSRWYFSGAGENEIEVLHIEIGIQWECRLASNPIGSNRIASIRSNWSKLIHFNAELTLMYTASAKRACKTNGAGFHDERVRTIVRIGFVSLIVWTFIGFWCRRIETQACLQELQQQTQGNSRVGVGVFDCRPLVSLFSFQNARKQYSIN